MATVTLSQSRAVPVPVEEAFDRVLPQPLTEIFRRRRLAIPPVKQVRNQTGAWGSVGQTRTIVTADGGTMLETLASNDRPHSFGYTISDVGGPMKPLVARRCPPSVRSGAAMRDRRSRRSRASCSGD